MITPGSLSRGVFGMLDSSPDRQMRFAKPRSILRRKKREGVGGDVAEDGEDDDGSNYEPYPAWADVRELGGRLAE